MNVGMKPPFGGRHAADAGSRASGPRRPEARLDPGPSRPVGTGRRARPSLPAAGPRDDRSHGDPGRGHDLRHALLHRVRAARRPGDDGMDPGAILVATCLASAFATLLMGLWAHYPIAVAPAMGHNFYFAFTGRLSHMITRTFFGLLFVGFPVVLAIKIAA